MSRLRVSPMEGRPLLDIASYARRGPEHRNRLSSAEIELIARTVRRVPEVMVKVSGGGTSVAGVVAHLKYIDRQGKLEIESDEGEQVRGKGSEGTLIDGWNLDIDAADARSPYRGTPGRRPAKLVHNIVLSMPAGTSPVGLLKASHAFAREQFAVKHRYAMVLHTDQDHPHVHLVVKAMSEQGERLNIRKATLREWRREFGRHLRQQGIAASATERAVRGESKVHKIDHIYRAARRGESTHTRDRIELVATELLKGNLRVERGKKTLLRTRSEVERGWRAMSEILVRHGQPELAAQVRQFVGQMSPLRTEKEQLAAELFRRTREARAHNQHLTR